MPTKQEAGDARRLVHDTAVLTGGTVLSLAIGLVATIVVTRALGPDARGVYAWLLTLAGIATQVATLATPHAVRAVTDEKDGPLAATLTVLCLFGAMLTIPLAIWAVLDPTLGPDARPFLPIVWASVPIAAIAAALGTLVQVHGTAWQVVAVMAAPSIVQTLLLLGLMPIGAVDLSASLWIFLAATAADLCLTLAILRQPGRNFVPKASLMRSFAGLLGAGWLSALAMSCLPKASLLALGPTAPPGVTGQYSVALTLQQAMTILPAAAGAVFVTHLRRHGLPSARQGAFGAAILLGATAALCLVSALTAPALVPFLFGAAYAPAATLYALLLPGIVLAAIYQLCLPVLFARRQAVDVAVAPVAGLAVSAAVAAFAVPRLGAEGAVGANLAGYGCLAAVGLWSVFRPGAGLAFREGAAS